MKKFKLFKNLIRGLRDIKSVEIMERSEGVEVLAKHFEKDVIVSITVNEYPPLPTDIGYFKEVVDRKRKSKGAKENKIKYIRERKRMKYCLTKDEENFIRKSYCNYHLDQRQISKVADIPQETIYTFIRQKKLKPVFDRTIKRQSRNRKYESFDEFCKYENGKLDNDIIKRHDYDDLPEDFKKTMEDAEYDRENL